MKYNEFLNLQKILKENYLTIDDVKKHPEVLNEISLGGAILGVLTLGGLLGIFGKSLMRLGIKKYYINNLEKIAENFQTQIISQASQLGKKSAEIRQNLVKKEKELQAAGSPEAKAELEAIQQQKREYERRFVKDTNEFISKIASAKTKEIYEKIDEVKKLKDSQKSALKVFWETKVPHIRLLAFNQLIKDGIVTDRDLIGDIQEELKKKLEESKKKAEEAINNVKKEKDKEPEKPKEEGKQADPDSIKNNIDELYDEKDRSDDETVDKKIKLIMNDIRKVPQEDRGELYKYLVDKFGMERITKIRSSKKEETKDDAKQTILKQEDEL